MAYTKLFTNDKRQKRKFIHILDNDFKNANKLIIASGYIGASTIKNLESKILKVAKRGEFKLLIGMVYHGGVTKNQSLALTSLDEKLRMISKDSGVYISREQYHGKIYKFLHEDNCNIYLGSSNFSQEGLDTRLEATTLIEDHCLTDEISDYLEYLFNQSTTAKLSDVELRIKGSKKVKSSISQNLKDYEISSKDYPNRSLALGVCNIKLRVDSQPKSSLNLYFDKGRKNKKGKYAPRPWYEVEITATQEEIKNPFYPISKLIALGKKSRKGNFKGYFKEGDKYYRIEMVVHADNGKNLSSSELSGGRETLGKLIKGRLERAGVLKEGELITSDVLDAYGNDTLKLIKITEDTYIIEF